MHNKASLKAGCVIRTIGALNHIMFLKGIDSRVQNSKFSMPFVRCRDADWPIDETRLFLESF